MTRACGCGAALGARNRSGQCRSCVARRINADPAVIAARAAAVRRHHAQPHVRAASAARLAAHIANMSDEERARRSEAGKRNAGHLAAAARSMTPEMRAENGRKRSATVLAWCPPEWRDKYRLVKSGRSAAAARRIVLAMIAGAPGPADGRKASRITWCPPHRREEYDRARRALGAAEARRIIEADMTPFERQLARVAAGAGIVTSHPLRRPGPSMTLGGVTPEAI